MPATNFLLKPFAGRFGSENFSWTLTFRTIHFCCPTFLSRLLRKSPQSGKPELPREEQMKATTYHPYRFDPISRARSTVRQILLFWLFGSIAIFCFDPSWPPLTIVPAVLFGFIPGLVLWFLFRIVRFAFPR
jgi:hypothetical protein